MTHVAECRAFWRFRELVGFDVHPDDQPALFRECQLGAMAEEEDDWREFDPAEAFDRDVESRLAYQNEVEWAQIKVGGTD